MSYGELSEEEKAALEVVLSQDSAIGVLSKFFGDKISSSTLYRKMYAGQSSLVQRGILNSNNAYQLTDKACTVVPPEKLARAFQALKSELADRDEKIRKGEERARSLELNGKSLAIQKERLEKIVQKFQCISQALDAFSFLGIDENWISSLVCSTVLEFSIKDKLAKLGCAASEVANISFDGLMKKFNAFLKEKEGRNYDGLFDPEAIRSTRNKLVHEGYKTKINSDEANAIFVITDNIVRNINSARAKYEKSSLSRPTDKNNG
jgi:uncharacterized protein with von Willebrand factor type A (vWA) domain